MPMEEDPVVGAMYQDSEGLAFEILSFNEDEGLIEIQYEDGDVDEIDIDAWYELDLEPLKPGAWKNADEDEAEEEEEEEEKPARGKAEDEDDDDDFDEDTDNENGEQE
ncbi:MAG: hypothetical protein HY308_08540 [Gammaproteobacteria bacterium]|nr:hypothetical protein [Gammaproteobacteria bacterium]